LAEIEDFKPKSIVALPYQYLKYDLIKDIVCWPSSWQV